jgi:hypothetical protein
MAAWSYFIVSHSEMESAPVSLLRQTIEIEKGQVWVKSKVGILAKTVKA